MSCAGTATAAAEKQLVLSGTIGTGIKGTPSSGKFEVDERHFQLSVDTAQGGRFAEGLIDCEAGTLVKSEPITIGDDLEAAKLQVAAMASLTFRTSPDVFAGNYRRLPAV